MKLRVESAVNRIKSYVSEFMKKIVITHKLDYDKFDIYVHDNIRLGSCKKEPGTVKWIETFDKNDVVFDVGANIGAYSLIMSKYAKKVYSFEPSAFSFNGLLKNVFTNNASNIVPLNIAVSDKKKIETFHYASTALGGSGHGGLSEVQGVCQQEVLAYSLDEFVEEYKIPVPQHIKIDVDGIEAAILSGSENILKSHAFKSLAVELDEVDKKTREFLVSLGLTEKDKWHIGSDKLYNYLFVRE